MDWILGNLAILGMIILAARQAQIPPEMVLAIIERESGGNPHAAKISPNYIYTMPQAKRPGMCDINTESYMQKTAWGLMQIMGATARSTGFDGWLPELIDPKINVAVGVAHLSNLMTRHYNKYGVAGVIAAYNGGAPRQRPDGKYLNQWYVDEVSKGMKKYETVIKEKEEEAVAEVTKTEDADKEPGEVTPENSEPGEIESTGKQDDIPQPEIDLGKMNRTQLLDFAKLNGITIDPKAKVDDIRDAIAAAGRKEPE